MNHLKIPLIILIVSLGAAGSLQASSDDQSSVEGREIVQDSARSRFKLPNLFNFERYQELFNKHYKSITETALRAKMYLARAFRAFVSMIDYKHRKSSWYLNVNQMSDWTPSEIENIFMKKPANGNTRSDTGTITKPAQAKIGNSEGIVLPKQDSIVPPSNTVNTFNYVPTSDSFMNAFNELTMLINNYSANPPDDVVYIDHRNCLPEVEWQGSCGSCYAFATMALYEWAYCRAKNKLIYFSKQYVVDCGEKDRFLSGCSGGSPMYVREFVLNNGLLREEEYRYKDKKFDCLYPAWVSADERGTVRIYDYGFDVTSVDTVEEQLKIAPLVMNVGYDPLCSKLLEYGGGVDDNIDCSGGPQMTHAMLLVGSGREDGQDYFLLRNSFGVGWGVKGYYKMSKKHKSIINYDGLVIKFPDQPIIDEVMPGQSVKEVAARNNLMKLKMFAILRGD